LLAAVHDLAAPTGRAHEAMDEHHASLRRRPEMARVRVDGRSSLLMPTRIIRSDLVRILDGLVGAANTRSGAPRHRVPRRLDV
jgi:hypothetical protein